MDISKLQRNADIVQKALKKSGNSLVATKRCKIYIPESYIGNFLGAMEDDIRIVGIHAIVVDDKYYAVNNTPAMMTVEPSATSIVEVEMVKYMELTFEPGDLVYANLDLVKLNTLIFRIFDNFIAKGKVPWYFSYDDLGQLMLLAKKHGGANLGVEAAILELFVSTMARDPKKRSDFYRHKVKTKEAVGKTQPDYVPLNAVAHTASNTTAKLLGSYFQDGVTSSLNTPSERNESIEDLLRK